MGLPADDEGRYNPLQPKLLDNLLAGAVAGISGTLAYKCNFLPTHTLTPPLSSQRISNRFGQDTPPVGLL